MKLFLAFILAICVYLVPIGGAETTMFDMKEKATLSFLLIAFIRLLSIEWWAIAISVIELSLIIVTFMVLLNWPNVTPLVSHYGAIQEAAFSLEILIILGAAIHGGRTLIGRFADYCRRVLHLAGH